MNSSNKSSVLTELFLEDKIILCRLSLTSTLKRSMEMCETRDVPQDEHPPRLSFDEVIDIFALASLPFFATRCIFYK